MYCLTHFTAGFYRYFARQCVCNCLLAYFIYFIRCLHVTLNLWNCTFHEIGKHIAQFVKWAQCLPISRTGQYRCRFREMGIRKPAHFTKWANVVNEIYIFVHAIPMHGGAVRQRRRLYIFKVFIEYSLNLDSGCISMHSSTMKHTQLKVTVL